MHIKSDINPRFWCALNQESRQQTGNRQFDLRLKHYPHLNAMQLFCFDRFGVRIVSVRLFYSNCMFVVRVKNDMYFIWYALQYTGLCAANGKPKFNYNKSEWFYLCHIHSNRHGSYFWPFKSSSAVAMRQSLESVIIYHCQFNVLTTMIKKSHAIKFMWIAIDAYDYPDNRTIHKATNLKCSHSFM